MYFQTTNLKLDSQHTILIRYKALNTANKKRFEPNFG